MAGSKSTNKPKEPKSAKPATTHGPPTPSPTPADDSTPVPPPPGHGRVENPKPYRFLMLFRKEARFADVRAAIVAAKFDLVAFDDWFKPQPGGREASNRALYCENLNCSVLTVLPGEMAALQALTEQPLFHHLLLEEKMTTQTADAAPNPLPGSSATSAYAKGYSDGASRVLDALPAALSDFQLPEEVAAKLSAFCQGYRGCLQQVVPDLAYPRQPRADRRLTANQAAGAPGALSRARFEDTVELAWGLCAINAGKSDGPTGKGVRVAVLDTGIDEQHPDFPAGRIVAKRSFVRGQEVQDGNGHGTCMAGIVAGAVKPKEGPRYGVAPEAELVVCKVLNNSGEGDEGDVVAGISWALEQGARVLLLPFGAWRAGLDVYAFYEELAERVLDKKALLIAAAGNHASRPASIAQHVSIPASCPSVLGIGAVDAALEMACFSGVRGKQAGGIDLAAPGYHVRSAWRGAGYRNSAGTSCAAAFAAGVAALRLEANVCTALELFADLLRFASALPQDANQVGRGLVQAPAAV